jgi:hypothetical protein
MWMTGPTASPAGAESRAERKIFRLRAFDPIDQREDPEEREKVAETEHAERKSEKRRSAVVKGQPGRMRSAS